MYATHFFDGLDDWTTHVMYLKAGRTDGVKRIQDFEDWQERKDRGEHNPLLRAVEKKMRAQRAEEQNFEPAELKAKEAKNSLFGPQGGFASGRFHNYWG